MTTFHAAVARRIVRQGEVIGFVPKCAGCAWRGPEYLTEDHGGAQARTMALLTAEAHVLSAESPVVAMGHLVSSVSDMTAAAHKAMVAARALFLTTEAPRISTALEHVLAAVQSFVQEVLRLAEGDKSGERFQ